MGKILKNILANEKNCMQIVSAPYLCLPFLPLPIEDVKWLLCTIL